MHQAFSPTRTYVIVDFDDRAIRVCHTRKEFDEALQELADELGEDAKPNLEDRTLFAFISGEKIREIEPTVKYKITVELPEENNER